MYIKELTLNNFRCYKQAEISFSPGINIIIGGNAAGKTSLVEAIHFACSAKSNKTSTDKEAIMFDQEFFLIESKIVKDDRLEKISFGFEQKSKRITVNGKVINKFSEFVGKYKVVYFTPDDLKIIKGTPIERRHFLDVNISQEDWDYLEDLMFYKKILKTRNELLKEKTLDLDLIKIYSKKLIEKGTTLINKRQAFIDEINPYFKNKENVISSQEDVGTIVYNPNTNVDKYVENFENSFNRDKMTQTTNVGPHKDDFRVLINGVDSALYGSQGQIRTVCIALKFALGEYLISKGSSIVIILDDVFSELDEARQNQMMLLLEKGNQIFITTTSIDLIDKEIIDRSKIIKVEKGGVLHG